MGRVGNKKSRTGCARCKSRRVKCDEVRPSCGWCTSHDEECEYPTPPGTGPARAVSSSATPETHHDNPTPVQTKSKSSVETACTRLELGLFQYYTFTVAKTFPYVDRDRGFELHGNMVPRASLQCESLRDVMYAYALLHIHMQSSCHGVLPSNSDFFEDAGVQFSTNDNIPETHRTNALSLHQQYLDRALQAQRSEVVSLHSQNADGVCIAAVLLAQVALIHSSQMRRGNEYNVPTDWFRLQSSFSTCLAITRPLLNMDSATSVMIHSSPGIDNRDLEVQNPVIFRDLLCWQPNSVEEDLTHQLGETLRKCVVYIETIYNRVAEKEPWQSLGRRILAFPAIGLSTFATALESHQPRALVILAHILAMTKRLDGKWWIFEGVADHHVNGIATLIPSEWQWALQWPMRVIETDAADDCFQPAITPRTNHSDETRVLH